MAFVDWNSNYSVGVSKFDQHHKQLFNLLNTLGDSMNQGKGTEAVGKILESLIQYTRVHFQEEEKAMLKYQYPKLSVHQHEHAELTAKVEAFSIEFKEGRSTITVGLLQFLSSWLRQHIAKSDKEYGTFFGSLGVSGII